MPDGPAFESQQRSEIVLFFKPPTPDLGVTWLPIQRVPGFFPRDKGERDLNLMSHLHLVSSVRISGTLCVLMVRTEKYFYLPYCYYYYY